jgi:hypothetical protein
MKIHILKITDRDDRNSDDQYHTIKSLREYILNEWYDIWEEMHAPHEQDYTKEQIKESDEDMFSWLNGWGYDIEIIYTITEKDI